MPKAEDGGLCRIRLEQGRITAAQLRLLGRLATTHGNGVIELTSRANIQLRGILPVDAKNLVQALEAGAMAPKNPASDGIRNVMVNPTAGFDLKGDARILPLAQEISTLLQTDRRYHTLSPKFSIFIDGGEACALVNHISDIWLSLCDGGRNFAFGLASCPPLVTKEGEAKERRSTPPALGKVPFADAKRLIVTLIDLLLDQRRQQPAIERMKHIMAVDHMADHMAHRIRQKCSLIEEGKDFCRADPKPHAHLGIHPTQIEQFHKTVQRFYLGIKPPLGRLTPAMAQFIADQMEPATHLRLTPWQSLILPDLDWHRAQELALHCRNAGFITDAHDSLAHIICCVGRPGCAAARAQVRPDAIKLAQLMHNQSFSSMSSSSIHLSGCAKSCAANQARAVTLLARDEGIYDLFIADKTSLSRFGRLAACSVTIEQAATWLRRRMRFDRSAYLL